MTSSDLIWNLIMMLIDKNGDSREEKETNDKKD